MLTETDRAEIAALVEETLAGRGLGVAARPVTSTRRPVRLRRSETPAVGERPAFSPSDGLAELGRSLAELRGELAERLDYEARQREELARHVHEVLEQARGGQAGGQSGGGQAAVPGIPPVRGQQGPGAGAVLGGSTSLTGGSTSAAGGKPDGASTDRPQWADPTQGSGQGAPAGTGGSQAQGQAVPYQGAVHKLAQANFDLAEALNENLRNLKEIVDRSQELVARIENILRRQAGGRQGA